VSGRYVDAIPKPASVIILPVVRIERRSRSAVGRIGRRQQRRRRADGGAGGARRVVSGAFRSKPMIDRLPNGLAVAAAFGLLTGLRHLRRLRRVRPSLVNDDTHAWIGAGGSARACNQSGLEASAHRRGAHAADLAYSLIEPP